MAKKTGIYSKLWEFAKKKEKGPKDPINEGGSPHKPYIPSEADKKKMKEAIEKLRKGGGKKKGQTKDEGWKMTNIESKGMYGMKTKSYKHGGKNNYNGNHQYD